MQISIIIPMGRPESAERTIRSILDQDFLPEGLEIVLAGVRAEEMASRFDRDFIVPVVLDRRLNPSRTRIAGIDAAKGDWFLLVDDDIELDSLFLKKLEATLSRERNLGAVGARLPGKESTYFSKVTDLANFWSQQCLHGDSRDWLYSAAMALSAKAYHKAGGFDPRYAIGEDVDLTQRIRQAGFRILYDPGLIAYHNHRRTGLRQALSYFWRNGELARYLFESQPGLFLFSLKSIWRNTVSGLKSTSRYNLADYPGFRACLPGVVLMYAVFYTSLEIYRHRYALEYLMNHEGDTVPAPRRSAERLLAAAVRSRKESRKIKGACCYGLALVAGFFG